MTKTVVEVIQEELDADPGPNPPMLAERIAIALGAADLLWRPDEPSDDQKVRKLSAFHCDFGCKYPSHQFGCPFYRGGVIT